MIPLRDPSDCSYIYSDETLSSSLMLSQDMREGGGRGERRSLTVLIWSYEAGSRRQTVVDNVHIRTGGGGVRQADDAWTYRSAYCNTKMSQYIEWMKIAEATYPLRSGMTWPTPVLEWMMFWAAPRPPFQSFPERPSMVFWEAVYESMAVMRAAVRGLRLGCYVWRWRSGVGGSGGLGCVFRFASWWLGLHSCQVAWCQAMKGMVVHANWRCSRILCGRSVFMSCCHNMDSDMACLYVYSWMARKSKTPISVRCFTNIPWHESHNLHFRHVLTAV